MARYLTRLAVSIPGSEHLNDEYDAIVKRTGEMVIAWARLDERLSRAFGYLAECDPQTAKIIYYTPSAFSGRMDMILNLTRHSMPDGPEKDIFLKVLNKIDKLHKTRNSIIHSDVSLTMLGPTKAQIERSEIRPATKDLGRRFKAKAHDIEHHLDLVEYALQYLSKFAAPNGLPFGQAAIDHWASMLLNTASATSS